MKKHQLFLTTLQKKLPAYYKLVILYIELQFMFEGYKKEGCKKNIKCFIFLYFPYYGTGRW